MHSGDFRFSLSGGLLVSLQVSGMSFDGLKFIFVARILQLCNGNFHSYFSPFFGMVFKKRFPKLAFPVSSGIPLSPNATLSNLTNCHCGTS